jgi:hypothetical protein
MIVTIHKAQRYLSEWTDWRVIMGASHRRTLDTGQLATVEGMVRKAQRGSTKAGYDPNEKRMTCPKHGLTWHRYGLFSKDWKCVECCEYKP